MLVFLAWFVHAHEFIHAGWEESVVLKPSSHSGQRCFHAGITDGRKASWTMAASGEEKASRPSTVCSSGNRRTCKLGITCSNVAGRSRKEAVVLGVGGSCFPTNTAPPHSVHTQLVLGLLLAFLQAPAQTAGQLISLQRKAWAA